MGFLGLKTNCLFCGNKSLRVSQNLSRESHLILMKWGVDSSRSFCQLLNLDQAKSMSSFNSASYCESCHQMFTDVLFLQRSIQAFQDGLNDIKDLSTALILDNYKRSILCEDSPFADEVGVGGLMENAYYEALKSIGTALLPSPFELKNKSDPQESAKTDFEETEDCVSTFVELRRGGTSEYSHQEGVTEEISSREVANSQGQLR